MIQHFRNRVLELEFLEKKYSSKGFQLIVLYGRRRVGKTELIKKFLSDKKGSYILCTRDGIKENLRETREKFAEITGKEYFRSLETDSFYELFRHLAEEIKDEKIVLAIDEFPYMTELDKGTTSVFQKTIDNLLIKTNVFLILCGSSVGMMETEVLDYRSPLYGRRTGDWKIEPFTFREVKNMFPKKTIEETIKIWAVAGGTPYYLSRLDEGDKIEDNIKNKLLTKGEILYSEPKILLKEEFREPRTYMLILKYLSLGYNTLGGLCQATGIEKGNLSKYLSTLEETNIIRHILPIGQRKRGIYSINDPLFNFYFSFNYPNQSDLEMGLVEEVYRRNTDRLNAYYGKRFEEIIAELLKKGEIKLSHKIDTVGTWWHKEQEIDLIAADKGAKNITFIECKWSKVKQRDAERTIQNLKNKAETVDWNKGKRTEHYGIIAKDLTGKKELREQRITALDLKDLI